MVLGATTTHSGKVRLSYTEDYKTNAVKSAYVEGRTETGERLDIPEATLRRWIKQTPLWCDLCDTEVNEGRGAAWENLEETGNTFVCINCSMRVEKLRNNYN